MVDADVGYLVRAPKTAELIAARMRAQIVRGELSAGDTLPPEIDLMRRFGVSRPTLREAFRILETESLLQVRRGSRGGAQVTAPELSVAARYVGLLLQIQGATIGDVYAARTILEPVCAGLFADRRTAEDVAELWDAIRDLQRVTDSPVMDVPRWSTLSYRFHELVMRGSGNQTLAIQGGVLQDIAATHVAATVSRNYHRGERAADFQNLLRSFAKLVDLIEGGDAAAAEAHWASHMAAAGESLVGDVGSTAVVELFTETVVGRRAT